MKIILLFVGKTSDKYLQEEIAKYSKKIKYFTNFTIEVIPEIRKNRALSVAQQKELEGKKILLKKGATRELHLFDEKGVSYSSIEFAQFLQKRLDNGTKELLMVIGGPYGFSESVINQSASKISLSRMTFSHQLARLLCIEQLYRAFCIIKGYPYHNE